MPFKSIAQQHYLEAAKSRGEVKPSVVKHFEEATPKKAYEHLPEHVKKMAHGGYACMSCGGEVDSDGYSTGGEVSEDEEEARYGPDAEDDEETSRKKHSLFLKALMGGRTS